MIAGWGIGEVCWKADMVFVGIVRWRGGMSGWFLVGYFQVV